VSATPKYASYNGTYYYWNQVKWKDGYSGWTADVGLGLAFGVSVGSFTLNNVSVPAYSNGYPIYFAKDDPDNTDPSNAYGVKWQCVEYVNRFYHEVYGMNLPKTYNGTDYYGHSATLGLIPNRQGGTNAPQAGDLLCFSGTGSEANGHVAIVRRVDLNAGLVYVIQENGTEDRNDENFPLKITIASGTYSIDAHSLSPLLSVQGWLRSPVASNTTPSARLLATNPPVLGQATLAVSIIYQASGDTKIIASSIDVNDIWVSGPYSPTALAPVNISLSSGDASSLTVTYTVPAPNSTWGPADNGTYTVWLRPNQVKDTAGNFVTASSLGSFTVAIDTQDITPPIVNTLSGPQSVAPESSFTVGWNVSDSGGSGLNRVELWMTNYTDSAGNPVWHWHDPGYADSLVQTISLVSTGNGPIPGSFQVNGLPVGTYFIGIHVVDGAGNWNDERGSQSPSKPSSLAPLKVMVAGSPPSIAVEAPDQIGAFHGFDFGSVTTGFTKSLTLTVRNRGTQSLNLTRVSLLTSIFSINLLDASGNSQDFTAIPANGTRTLSLTFAPTVTGTASATLTLTSNDPNQPNYQIALTGTGVAPATPAMSITGFFGGMGADIWNGMGNPDWAYGTEFGFVSQNSAPPTRTYVVTNTGTGNLELGPVTVPTGYSVIAPLATSIPQGGTANFTVQLNTNTLGTFNGYVNIQNNAWRYGDRNQGLEGPFTFAIGAAVKIAAPVITGIVHGSGRGTTAGFYPITNDPRPILRGTAIPNSTVTVWDTTTNETGTTAVDGSGAWTFTMGVRTDGIYQLLAKTTDQNGNTGLWSNNFFATVDTTPPAAPKITDITKTDASGRFTLAITGTAEVTSNGSPTTMVTLFDNGIAVGATLADNSGAWALSYSPPTLASGNHDFTATATDVAGNVSSYSPTVAVTVIGSAPTGSVLFNGDPNDFTGPAGFGPSHFVTPTARLFYTISFSNEADATIPVQQVVITNKLDPSLDWSTFQVGDFNISGVDYSVPPNHGSLNTRLDFTSTLGIYVDVSVRLDLSTGIVIWRFTSIDPATGGLPSNIFSGFLPPDQTAPRGEAFVIYSVQPKAAARAGTIIKAQANVIFDANPAEGTPQVTNTITPTGTTITAKVSSSAPSGASFGEPITFTTNVKAIDSPLAPIGGTVSFFLNGTELLGKANLVAGAASFTTTAIQLPVNTTPGNKITAVYNSSNPANPKSAVFKASASSEAYFQIVNKATTSVAVSASAPMSGSFFGQSVIFTAVVSITSPGTPGMPTSAGATVTFFDGPSFLGKGTLYATSATSATYRFKTSTLIVGMHTIFATYSGAAKFVGSTNSSAFSHTVNQALTSTTMTSSPALWASDKPTTFTAVVKVVAGAGPLSTGASLIFNDGAVVLGDGKLIARTATSATYQLTTQLSADSHSVSATYSGNTAMAGSSSAVQMQAVHKFSRLLVSASAVPTPGTPVVLTMTLTGVGLVPIPNAIVSVNINGATYSVTTNALGVAKLSCTFAAEGTYSVTAFFASDDIFNDARFFTNLVVKRKLAPR
jgi:hypothetical protein